MEGFDVDHVSKTYFDAKGRRFPVLKDICFQWRPGENISIIGESGSGKSTLSRLLVGLEKPAGGTITWDGEQTDGWSRRIWREHRKIIQAVFQDAAGTLNPARSVFHNVEEALCNLTELNRSQRMERIRFLMELAHMRSELLSVPTRQLSGGEQRRLALLRALAIRPKFMVLDEVTSGLDLISSDAVIDLLEDYHREYGCSYLLITHDREIACRISSRILEMREGALIREGVLKSL